jgi:hypothetical protein
MYLAVRVPMTTSGSKAQPNYLRSPGGAAGPSGVLQDARSNRSAQQGAAVGVRSCGHPDPRRQQPDPAHGDYPPACSARPHRADMRGKAGWGLKSAGGRPHIPTLLHKLQRGERSVVRLGFLPSPSVG